MTEAHNKPDYREIRILDKGYVKLVDHMGSDQSIVAAARVSYEKGTKTVRDDASLIDYLIRNHHCYSGDMEVLTARGWVKWSDCEETEMYAVPDPSNKTIKFEELATEVFDYNGPMCAFTNSRMSYCVTPNHRMWFKGKYQNTYKIVEAQHMSYWGHFDSINNYQMYDSNSVDVDKMFWLYGFYLGDGMNYSTNRISFHLQKQRKVDKLKECLKVLNLEYTCKHTEQDTYLFSVERPSEFNNFVDSNAKAHNKQFIGTISNMLSSQLEGLYQGLVDSDGSYKADREQIEFSSTSTKLTNLFSLLSSLRGNDCHYVKTVEENNCVKAYYGNSTTLEARKQYFSNADLDGKVYCTTTSTGLLLVRGAKDKYAFVCGNTSPLEMVEFVFEMKLPLFVARQMVRHRTASLNEVSARYSVLEDEFYIPDTSRMNPQSATNKQGSESVVVEGAERLVDTIQNMSQNAYATYEELLDNGLSRELARMVLPTNIYTKWVWKCDLNNLLKFLTLRADAHAQYEIRVYADAMLELIEPFVPSVVRSYKNHFLHKTTFSKDEMDLLMEYLVKLNIEVPETWSATKKREFLNKVSNG